MKYRFILITLVLLALGLTTAYAGNTKRLGTAGAQELLIPVGSRGTAMGGAVLADVSGIEAMYWNPAGLADLEGTEAMFTHLPYMADIDINFFGIATYLEGLGTVGVGAKIVDIGTIQETTEADPDGTGREFSPTLTVLNLTYSRILTANVSVGVNAMYIREDIFEVSASGVAFDVGFTYDPGWRGLRLGLVVKNYGPEMSFSGRGFERSLGQRPARPNAATFDLPSSLNIGLSYDLLDQGPSVASLSGNFRSNNYSQDQWTGGFEYAYNERYFLRGGYTYADQDEFVYGATFGAGLTYPMGDTKLIFEYAWNDVETFDANQYFTLRFAF
ncbi:PorV/PorQ family protein [candidate division GN15 bacterium]|nr:PorV/PorQ family protein [candidate division GN15 bacterium]